MNLIIDKWIPAHRADGTSGKIAPWEIGQSKNPVVALSPPRPDFRGALYQFLIGLVQTAYPPKDNDDWEEHWSKTPSCEDLKAAFMKFSDAFELVNDGGGAFMQDYNLPPKAKETKIRSLLTNSPGENTVKFNKDLFVKRDCIEGLCNDCTATALLALQIDGVAVGAGYRVGVRGGGPLTTLIIPTGPKFFIWNTIWANILPLSEEKRFLTKQSEPLMNIFPWMGLTKESKNNIKTYPEDVSALQFFWAMPQRIRLSKFVENGNCDICGEKGLLWIAHRTTNYGISYSSTWQHTLSPYRRQLEDDGSICLLSTKGKEGGFAYPDWLSLTLSNDDDEKAAKVVHSFVAHKLFFISGEINYSLWCFGYDAKNAKIRCWYDQTMPLLAISDDKRESFIAEIHKMISAAEDTSRLLHNEVKAAWSDRPKDLKGDTSYIQATFWEQTETAFFEAAVRILKAVEKNQDTSPVLLEWRKSIIAAAERLFDSHALQNTDDTKNMKRIALASKALSAILNSPNTQSLQALKEGA